MNPVQNRPLIFLECTNEYAAGENTNLSTFLEPS